MSSLEYKKPVVAIFEPETDKIIESSRYKVAGLLFVFAGVGCGALAEVNWWLSTVGPSVGVGTSSYASVLWLRSIGLTAVGIALLIAARVTQSAGPILMVKRPADE